MTSPATGFGLRNADDGSRGEGCIAVGLVTWLGAKRFRRLAVAFGTAGLITLLFIGWLFWELGQGMANFD